MSSSIDLKFLMGRRASTKRSATMPLTAWRTTPQGHRGDVQHHPRGARQAFDTDDTKSAVGDIRTIRDGRMVI
jgi:hypothetical protein